MLKTHVPAVSVVASAIHPISCYSFQADDERNRRQFRETRLMREHVVQQRSVDSGIICNKLRHMRVLNSYIYSNA